MERKNTWSVNDDTLLADVVLSCIQNGETQLKAFEQAAAKLNRTASACGFRWNSTVRKNYEDILRGFKKGRKVKPNIVQTNEHVDNEVLVNLFNYIKELEQRIEDQEKEIEQLREQNRINKERSIANEELQTAMRIIAQAKHKGFLSKAN